MIVAIVVSAPEGWVGSRPYTHSNDERREAPAECTKTTSHRRTVKIETQEYHNTSVKHYDLDTGHMVVLEACDKMQVEGEGIAFLITRYTCSKGNK